MGRYPDSQSSEERPAAADRDILDFIPDKTDRTRIVTSRGGATHAVRPAGELSLVAESHYATVFLTAVPKIQASLNGSRMQEFDVPAGAIGVVPAGNEGVTIWRTMRETVSVAIPPATLSELAAAERDGGSFELRPAMATKVDPWALNLANLLRAELAGGPAANELYVDSLITLFGVHLIRNYSSRGKSPGRARGGLSTSGARRIQEFLSENFTGKLAVAELAAIAGVSPGHFIPAFARTFGVTPHQYVINLRLDFAERLLIEGAMTIAEIAYSSGFSSQSHLTATMRRYRHLTPAQMRGSK
ncbi:helix-turn-helix domain-containing protein [Rhizobiaceae sp. 2RAB30]